MSHVKSPLFYIILFYRFNEYHAAEQRNYIKYNSKHEYVMISRRIYGNRVFHAFFHICNGFLFSEMLYDELRRLITGPSSFYERELESRVGV